MLAADPAGLVIRPLNQSDSLEQLTDFLHRAYKALADRGLRYLATHQSEEITRQRIARGTCFVAFIDDRLLGTITYHPKGMARGSPWYNRPEVGKASQMAVEPEYQGQGIGRRLMDYVEEFARADGAQELAMDTAETAHHLIEWYARRGYRFIEHCQWEVTNYRSVVMSKRLVDTGL